MRRRGLALTICAAAVLTLAVPSAHAIQKRSFFYTGAEQMFTIPDGVHRLKMAAAGGRGGDTEDSSGGDAAVVISGAILTPGQTLYIEVGGNGASQPQGGAGGWN